MFRSISSSVVILLACVARLQGAGFVHSENFVVFTPAEANRATAQAFAEQVLQQAEKYRARIAEEWLGEELPSAAGRTVINVDFSDQEDRGLTWAKDHPDRKFHNIYLTTSRQRAVGSTLCHEIAHIVLATGYPHPSRLPPWLEEGIASRYDDPASLARRRRMIESWFRNGRVPRVDGVLARRSISAADDNAYAVATTLVGFLLTQGDRQTLLEFAADGGRIGWEASLERHYGMVGVAQLEAQWQAWLIARPPEHSSRS